MSEVRFAIRGSATEPLFLRGRALLDIASRSRKVAIELRQRDTGILLLVGTRERHAQLQEIVGRLRSFRVASVPFGEGTRRFGVFAAYIKGFAEPVLGAPRERIVGMLSDKGPKRLFRRRIVRLLQQSVRIV